MEAVSAPELHIVLVNPLIPQNTGNIARLSAATQATLHLVHPLGFEITESRVKRAGLDYWPWVKLQDHDSFEEFETWKAARHPDAPIYFLSKKAAHTYTDVAYQPGSFLVFGQETKGLPDAILEKYSAQTLRIPMFCENVRSLNLSNSVAIVVYEAIRQLGGE